LKPSRKQAFFYLSQEFFIPMSFATRFFPQAPRAVAVLSALAVLAAAQIVHAQPPTPRDALDRMQEAAQGRRVVAPGAAGAATLATSGPVSLYYPTGDRASSVLLMEKEGPSEVQAGRHFDLTVRLTNISTNVSLRNVVLIEELPGNFTISNSVPALAPGTSSDLARIGEGLTAYRANMGTLAPGETKTLAMTASAGETGQLVICETVEYDMFLCFVANVVEPELRLAKHAPAEVMICDPISMNLVVANTGTGVAQNVVVIDNLPEGLTVNGERSLRFEVGDLAAGQRREFEFTAKAERTGRFPNQASATAEGLSVDSNRTVTMVTQPVLEITKDGPAEDYINTRFDHRIVVRNIGDAVARNTVVTDQVPYGTQFESATDNGQNAGGVVTWNMGDLAPGDSRSVTVTLRGLEKGIIRNVARATAYCAAEVTAAHRTILYGVGAILLEAVDLEDPVKVGQDTTYVIRVTNQGSSTETNIQLDAVLEKMSFLDAEGPTQARHENRAIRFAPLPALEPKQSATWKIRAKAEAIGDVRFFVSLSSDQLTRPVQETEATTIYTEGTVGSRSNESGTGSAPVGATRDDGALVGP
jgi:uncharacterized repeat protein (TIGR01451 family)